ncbi:MAG: hypothetical protein GF364_04850 [Candidatus Lokiarchaeota archaeon]|nr:hypothetical protein [Candidatus Lokiarchaeota archaeon]
MRLTHLFESKKINAKHTICTIMVFEIALLIGFHSFFMDLGLSIPVSIYNGSGGQRIVEHPYAKEWITNGNYSNQMFPTWDNSTSGDDTDITLNYNESGMADAVVLGQESEFPIVADPPDDSWSKSENPDFPTLPDYSDIVEGGCCVSHYWDESADQSPSVNWNKQFTVPVNLSDYVITNAKLHAYINATVKAEGDNPGGGEYGLEVPGDSTQGGNQYATYDYARFYVLLSDPSGETKYEVAYFQTVDLGKDTPGHDIYDYLEDTEMNVVPEESLILFLSSVLNSDFQNFNVTLGIRLWCEDNWSSDDDEFTSLYIKNFSLIFNYRKKIDRFTYLNIEQIGSKINDGQGEVRLDSAYFNFAYKLNVTWPYESSPNSRIQSSINEKPLNESINLASATSNFLLAKPSPGYDVADIINLNENITTTIQIYLADDFKLNNSITISIDDVSLFIEYTVLERIDLPLSDDALALILILAIAILVLSYYLVKEKVVKPRNERIREALKLKTHIFEDARNIKGIYIIDKKRNSIRFKIAESAIKDLGHILPAYSSDIVKFSSNMNPQQEGEDGTAGNIIESAFDNCSVLVADDRVFRTALILNKPASEHLKHTTIILNDLIQNVQKEGEKEQFTKIIRDILHLDLLDIYTYAPEVNIRVIKKELDDVGKRIVDKCTKIYYKQKFFSLYQLIANISPEYMLETKSIILDMIDNDLLVPYDQITEDVKKQKVDIDKEIETLHANQNIEQTERWMEIMRKSAEGEEFPLIKNELIEQVKKILSNKKNRKTRKRIEKKS